MCAVRILILVDQNIVQALVVEISRFLRGVEKLDSFHDEIVEVHCVCRSQTVLVFTVDHSFQFWLLLMTGDMGASNTWCEGWRQSLEHFLRALQRVLPVRNLAGELARLILLHINVKISFNQLQQTQLILLIINREARFQTRFMREAPEDANTSRMECGNPQALCTLRADEFRQSFAHLCCSFIGESNRKNLARPCIPLAHHPGNTSSKNTSLT